MHDHTAFDINSPVSFFDFLRRLFTEDFMPHGHCYFWRPDVLWLNVLSDAGIVLAYYAIPIILICFVRQRRDIPFHWIFWMFGAFIFLCGTTHLVDVVTTWIPIYRFEGIVKFFTALVSMATAIALVPIMPKVISLPSLEMAMKKLQFKQNELEQTNQDLEKFNRAALGREERIIELKKEVNRWAKAAGKNPPYQMI